MLLASLQHLEVVNNTCLLFKEPTGPTLLSDAKFSRDDSLRIIVGKF